MSDPETGGGEGDGGEEVSCELVVARGDASEVFELVEEAFDEVALSVERGIDRALDLAVLLGRDVGPRAVIGDELDDGLGVIAPVGDGVAGRGKAVDERRHGGFVGDLARGQQEAQRQAAGIDDDVDLAAQPATGTANGVIRAPFFPPAAC